ncbi:MAG: cyclic pyranopterin monophosphate synthase MoaC [Thermoplasmata archaeon]
MAEMVDVGAKETVPRSATAVGAIRLRPATVDAIASGKVEKGDVVATAKLAAIQGAKRTPELIPLCHPLRLDAVKPDVILDGDRVVLRCTVTATDRTGVEMEALTAVSLGLLAVWDMVKGLEKDAEGQYPTTRILDLRVEEKRVQRNGASS